VDRRVRHGGPGSWELATRARRACSCSPWGGSGSSRLWSSGHSSGSSGICSGRLRVAQLRRDWASARSGLSLR
jgi:hypothetical protein